jgi:hypothetical protein
MPEVYRYPLTAYTEKTDYLQIDIVEYKSVKNNRNDGRSSIASQASSRNVGNSGKNKLTTIFLPIPGNISDNVSVRYGSSELNNIAGAAIGGIQGIMESSMLKVWEKVQRQLKMLLKVLLKELFRLLVI